MRGISCGRRSAIMTDMVRVRVPRVVRPVQCKPDLTSISRLFLGQVMFISMRVTRVF